MYFFNKQYTIYSEKVKYELILKNVFIDYIIFNYELI